MIIYKRCRFLLTQQNMMWHVHQAGCDLYDGEDVRDVIVASDELIASAGYLADRISVNLEIRLPQSHWL